MQPRRALLWRPRRGHSPAELISFASYAAAYYIIMCCALACYRREDDQVTEAIKPEVKAQSYLEKHGLDAPGWQVDSVRRSDDDDSWIVEFRDNINPGPGRHCDVHVYDDGHFEVFPGR